MMMSRSMRRLFSKIVDEACHRHDEKSGVVGEETMRRFEKQVLLQILDHTWKEHLAAMDYLRQGIHLRGYAQKESKSRNINARLLSCLRPCLIKSNENQSEY